MNTIRRSASRGFADHGWLRSFHTFAFADYFDPEHVEFGPLRVINEDRVAAGSGFGTHGHRDMEIVSYVLAGELAHKDSMGNGSTIRPGDVQRMSAGRGVLHSEFNPNAQNPVHFLQIWIKPEALGVEPSYEEKHFATAEKRGRLRLVVSPDAAQGSLRIHQNARIYAGLFDGEERATLHVAAGRRLYVHLASGTLDVNGATLHAGDALEITDAVYTGAVPAGAVPAGAVPADDASVVLEAGRDAEVLVFDLPPN